jgi:hypothetical protein
MQKRVTGPEIERLIQLLARVPGLGPRSARRAALHLIKKKDQLMGPLALAMNEAFDKVRICSTCGNADTPTRARSAPIPAAIRASSSSSRTSPISGRSSALRR